MNQYTLIRSKRYSVSLQVGRAGELIVRAPHFYPKFLIDRFVTSKDRWITKRRTLATQTASPPVRFLSDIELKSKIYHLVSHYSALMSTSPHSLRFTHVKTYWGSCSPASVLSFNLRLAFTSAEIVEYVVVHELAHIRWRGHGQRFWNLVTKYFPETPAIRHKLRQIPRTL